MNSLSMAMVQTFGKGSGRNCHYCLSFLNFKDSLVHDCWSWIVFILTACGFPDALQVAVKPPMAVTNAVSWRSEGIKYKKNEVFLDVVESVNLLVNSNGTVVRSEVVGALKMRTFLSGMPECKLGLNDKVHHLTCHNRGICGCCKYLVPVLLSAYYCWFRSEWRMHA